MSGPALQAWSHPTLSLYAYFSFREAHLFTKIVHDTYRELISSNNCDLEIIQPHVALSYMFFPVNIPPPQKKTFSFSFFQVYSRLYSLESIDSALVLGPSYDPIRLIQSQFAYLTKTKCVAYGEPPLPGLSIWARSVTLTTATEATKWHWPCASIRERP